MKLRRLLGLVAVLCCCALRAQLSPIAWPLGPGEGTPSDKYEVYVSHGTASEVRLDVVMSNAIAEGDFAAAELTGRTFSFAWLGYRPDGAPLRFRVVKKFGTGSTAVQIAPRRLEFSPALAAPNEAHFTVDATERYFSVHFVGADNATPVRRWIRHMLCIFIDPPEDTRPVRTDARVVAFSPSVDGAALAAAGTVFFPAGYHNLRAYAGGGPIADGILRLRSGQSVYLEAGAFVEGLIDTQATSDSNQRVFGRGILSGRLFPWYEKPGYTGPRYAQILRLGNNRAAIEGIMLMESPSHGIVGWQASITRLKFLGWHSNNDAVRVGSGSEISHSFIRAVDDHFYNFDIWAHDCVLWAGHNGAILTYGWGGDNTESTYNSGSSLLENIDIIHPEWFGLGNNNGLVAAQTGFDYRPFGYGGSTRTVLRNIRIEGSVPGLVNLKPRSGSNGTVVAVPVAADRVGYLGDLLLSDITVDAQSSRGRIRGGLNPAGAGSAPYFVQDVEFRNVRIGGQPVTAANAATHLEIEAATTRNLRFSAPPAEPRSLTASLNPAGEVALAWADASADETAFVVQRATSADGPWVSLPSVPADRTAVLDRGPAGGSVHHYRVRAENSVGASSWTSAATVTVPAQSGAPVRLVNASCRLRVDAGDTIIPGFVVAGPAPLRVLIRAVGPSLAAFLTGAMPDPQLELVANGSTVASNDNWTPALAALAADVGAFPLAPGSLDAALVATAAPGVNYSVVVRGRGAGTAAGGIVLVEVYALDGASSAASLGNLSIRARSGAGDRSLIVGLVLEGARSRPVLVRGLGPALRIFGIADYVPDPRLTIFDRSAQAIAADDNWSSASGLSRTFAGLGAFPLAPASADAAAFVALEAGAYTAQLADPDNRSGTALVEVYLAPN